LRFYQPYKTIVLPHYQAMRDLYVYQKAVRRHRYSRFRWRLGLVRLLVVVVTIIAAVIAYDLYNSNKNKPSPASAIKSSTIEDQVNTFRSEYFKFQDVGKWVLNTQESSNSKYIYYKYRGLAVQYQLVIYVNQVPIPLYLAVARALPVRIVNANSFDVTNVSDPCGKNYGLNELHKIKLVNINESTMLCDPDTPQYSVVLSRIEGDYQLNLQRRDGSPIQFVITFKDLTLDPRPDTIKRVADSFQSL